MPRVNLKEKLSKIIFFLQKYPIFLTTQTLINNFNIPQGSHRIAIPFLEKAGFKVLRLKNGRRKNTRKPRQNYNRKIGNAMRLIFF